MTDPWKPRCSSAGLNTICGFSAELTKKIHDGSQEVLDDMDFSSSAYADLGTIIHNELQTRLKCVMQTRLEESLAPMWDNASKLFKGQDDLKSVVETVVLHALSVFPTAPDGKPWVAEPEDELPDLKGHLDFESQDQTEIIDLKTTARKPDNRRMKPLHAYQLVSYWELRGKKAKRGRILYVDSMKGGWAVLTDPIEFDNPLVQTFSAGMKAKRDQVLEGVPQFPTPGDHCKAGFCPFRNSRICYNGIVPLGSQEFVRKGCEKKSGFVAPETSKVDLWN
jgi:hypothetical protein